MTSMCKQNSSKRASKILLSVISAKDLYSKKVSMEATTVISKFEKKNFIYHLISQYSLFYAVHVAHQYALSIDIANY